jgi:hypothetical protein
MRAILSALAVSAVTLASAGTAAAQEVAPAAAYHIDLGDVSGIAYYTVADEGYRVVATLGSGADAAPVRFTATLAPAQRLNISVPGAVGANTQAIDIVRDGDRIVVVPAEIVAN